MCRYSGKSSGHPAQLVACVVVKATSWTKKHEWAGRSCKLSSAIAVLHRGRPQASKVLGRSCSENPWNDARHKFQYFSGVSAISRPLQSVRAVDGQCAASSETGNIGPFSKPIIPKEYRNPRWIHRSSTPSRFTSFPNISTRSHWTSWAPTRSCYKFFGESGAWRFCTHLEW
jgi:hypothetical protein